MDGNDDENEVSATLRVYSNALPAEGGFSWRTSFTWVGIDVGAIAVIIGGIFLFQWLRDAFGSISINISEGVVPLSVGTTALQLHAITDARIEEWSSSNPSVVSIHNTNHTTVLNDRARLRGNAPGTATITARDINGRTGTFSVIVIAPQSSLAVSISSWPLSSGASTSSTINITSNTGWSISSNQSWLTPSRTTGTNNGTFTLSATANTNTASRNATVTIRTNDNTVTRTINVTQQGAPATSGGSYFTVAGVRVNYNLNTGAVAAGQVRFVHQLVANQHFRPEYWGNIVNNAFRACAMASASMAYSYLGINLLPSVISQSTGGFAMGPWNVSNLTTHIDSRFPQYFPITDQRVSTAVGRFLDNRTTYGPVIAREPGSTGTNDHWVIILGRSGSDYLIVDPANFNRRSAHQGIANA